MPLATLRTVVLRTARQFREDGAVSLAAAIAFYSVLSLAPVVLLLLWGAGAVWERQPVRDEIVRQIDELAGQEGARVVGDVLDRTFRPHTDAAALFGLLTLLLASTTVFAQIQYALNRVWNVRVRASERLWHIVRIRLVSLGLILVTGFVLLASLVVSSAQSFRVPGFDPAAWPVLWRLATFCSSLLAFTLVFAMIFKILPDARIAWRDVWKGAALTALLFGLGKELIGLYLGRSLLASAYGAAGSLVVLLLWVYFVSILLLAGAEFTQVWAHMRGRTIAPKAHAESTR